MTSVRTVRAGDWLSISARNHPDRDCLVTVHERFTYLAVNSRVNRLAQALRAHGIAERDRVALFATDSHRYMETLLASLKLGSTYVPLNFRLAEPELRNLLQVSQARVLFISSRYAELVERVRADMPCIELVVSYEGNGTGDIAFEGLLATGDDVEPDGVVNDEDVVGLAFTSGTTGLPKGVLHTQRLTKHLTNQCILERRLPMPFFHYSAAPLYHVAGMAYVYASIAAGSTSLILSEFDPAAVLRWMQSGEVTGCFLVPTMISALLQHPDVGAGSYDAIHSIAYGAAPISPSLLRRAMDTFQCEFMNMFGAGTEAGLQTVLTPEDHHRALDGHEHLLGSIGKPGIGIDLRLVDDDLNDVPQGEVGEIVTRADAVMGGYLGQPEATALAIVDGWFRGGDMAWEDREGYLYLSGRKNDMIIRGGENIYPIEIESVLAEVSGIIEVAVIGVQDSHWGEIVRAHLVLAAGQGFDEDAVRRHCRKRLAAYKVPAEFRVEHELPKNESGKILKRVLRLLP